MRISSFRIKNYKCFRDSGNLAFNTGFNLIVGQNNSGKTSLINALRLKYVGVPHASLKSKKTPTSRLEPLSEAFVTLLLSGGELRDLLLNNPRQYWVPSPLSGSGSQIDKEAFLEELFSAAEIKLSFMLASSSGAQGPVVPDPATYPMLGDYTAEQDQTHGTMFLLTVQDDRATYSISTEQRHERSTDFGVAVAQMLLARIYYFEAQRFNISTGGFGASRELSPNAANLPEVLGQLQGANPARNDRFNRLIHEVLPSIQRVTVRAASSGGAQQEILIWMIDPETEREDLAVTLAESGTGVGQVLAILYIIVMSEFSRTIIIDEPNSFLHPGAARKLIKILQQHHEHQYILATHAPEIISSSNANSLTMLTWNDGESSADQWGEGSSS